METAINEFEDIIKVFNENDIVKVFMAGEYDLLLEDLSVRGPEPLNIFTFFDPSSPHNLTYFKDPKISYMLSEIEGMVGAQRANAYSELSKYITSEQVYALPLFTDIRIFIFSKKVKAGDTPASILGNTPFERVNL